MAADGKLTASFLPMGFILITIITVAVRQNVYSEQRSEWWKPG